MSRESIEKTIALSLPIPSETAARNVLAVTDRAGLTVFDAEDVVDQVAGLIHSRTQLVELDADDLAWDILKLLGGKS